MQAISSARKKLFNSRYTCPVEVNGEACKDMSPPPVSPSSVGNGAESQSELSSSDFGFELVDFPDSVLERHASFDEKLFELRRQAPEQIAAQLTLWNLAAFKKIMPMEFHDGNWMKKQKSQLAPNLLAFTRQFNHMCFWVEREVLEERNLKLRGDTVAFFIRVAKKLQDLNNYHGMMAVVSALQSAPIHRLSLTWKVLPKKDKQLHNRLVELASSNNNHARLREQMRALRMPCIPHLALYLTDLAFLMTRQSSNEDPQTQTKIDAIVNTVVYFQNSNYEQLSLHKYIQAYLRLTDFIDELQSLIEREFFQKSKELEPDACGSLRLYKSSDELDEVRVSLPEAQSPSVIRALHMDRLLKRTNSWSSAHGRSAPVRHHTRSSSASPTQAMPVTSFSCAERGVAVQITEASPELQRQGHLGSASLSSSLPLRAEEGKGFEGSLLHHMNKKIASQLSPLASGKGPLSFARRRGHRKSNSLGENCTQSAGNLQGKPQTQTLTSGSNSASSGTSGMTSSISLLDDSLLCVPSPACSGSESSDDEDPESTSTVGFSRLSESEFSLWQQLGSVREGVLKRQLLKTSTGPVARSLQKKVKCTVHLTEHSLIMVKGKIKQPPKQTLLQTATVLPLRDRYVSFAEPMGRSSDKKQFVIADERGFAVRFISSSVRDAEGWVHAVRSAIEEYNRKLAETSLIKL